MSGLTSSNMGRLRSGWNAFSESALAAERPQQLDDLLRVPLPLPLPSGVAEPVQGIADLHVPQIPFFISLKASFPVASAFVNAFGEHPEGLALVRGFPACAE